MPKPMKKSFAVPSNKPVDVEYRLKRLRATIDDAQMFLGAIDPAVFPEIHAAIASALEAASLGAWGARAPAKKARGKKVVEATESEAAAAE